MFIICPKCAAKYKIPEGITLEEGQKLKCSACDFVFLKGEEAPFVLEKKEETASSVKENTLGEAFSIPLYTKAGETVEGGDSLPTEFQPIAETAPKKKGGLLVLVYLVLIVVFGAMAWTFRDSLRSNMSDIIPQMQTQQTNTRKRPKPIVLHAPVQVQDDSVTVRELPEIKRETVKESQHEEIPFETVPALEPKTNVPSNAVPSQNEAVLPDVPVDQKVETKPAEIAVVETEKPTIPVFPVVSETELPPEESEEADDIPLFEAIPPTTLSVEQIIYRIEPDETGADQLLVEGKLHNKTDEVKVIPTFTIFVLDEDNEILVQKQVHLSEEQLFPGQTIPFFTGITPAPENIERIDVKL